MPIPVWLVYAAITAVSAGVSYVSAKSAQKKAKQAAKANEGLLINSEGANNHIPVIYGVRRIAGTRVFVETGPGPRGANDFLYMVIVLCEGEVASITDFLIDDAPTTDLRFAYGDSIAINTYAGTDAQTVDPMFEAAGIGWDFGYDLKGLCYIAVRLRWNTDAFSSIPNITALVTGKKVYDPRTLTTEHSTNPALCIRDYLTNSRYGKGLNSSLIDDTAISAAATFYDTTVTYWTSGTVGKLFEFNLVLDTEQDILENIKDMLMCCRGFLPYTNGLYQLLPDKSSSSVFAFTTNEIVGGLSIRGESKDEKYNRVSCTFIDSTNNWQENTAIWPDSGSAEEISYLAEDGGVELIGDFDLPCITNYYAARDIARIFLARSRNALRASFVSTSEALNLSVGDVVTVTHPTPGWTAKPFQVEEITINFDGTVGVSLLEYDSSIYTYDPASEQIAYTDTNLPNPFLVLAPTAFVITEDSTLGKDGSVVPTILVRWTAAQDAFVEIYEFQYRLSGTTDYLSTETREPFAAAQGTVVGTAYDIRVRSVNSLGVSSDWLASTYTIIGDTTAPAIPTGLTIVGDYNQATLNWNAATEKDYKETLIYASLTNDSATATLQSRISGTTVTVAGLPVSTTYYVWLKNEDFSGNISGFSGMTSFNTTTGASASTVIAGGTIDGSVTSGGVSIDTIRTNAEQALLDAATAQAGVDSKIQSFYQASAPTSNVDNGDIWIDTDAGNKLYIRVSGVWTDAQDDAVATAIIAASDAQATADGKVVTFLQTSPPSAEGAGDLWVDTDDGNKLYRASAAGTGGWVTVRDTTIATAQSTANTGVSNAATAQSTANTALADAAIGKSLSNTLLVSGTATLRGVIQPDNTGAIRTGSITWNSTTGALSGGTGIAMTEWGIIGAAGGVPTFSIEATTGNAIFKGNITGATGTFSGDLVTSGQVNSTGITTSAVGSACIVGNSSTSGVRGGVFLATNTTGVVGVSASGVGVYGTTSSTSAAAPGVLGTSGAGGYAFATETGGIIINNPNSNMIIGAATNTGANNLVIKEGAAGARLNNQILIYGQLSASSKTTLGLVVEQDVEAGTGSFAGLLQLRIHINGVAYKLPLEAY